MSADGSDDIPPLTLEQRRAVMAELGPYAAIRLNSRYLLADYLAPFARSVWGAANGVDLPWPKGPFMQIMALELQKAGLEHSARTVLTVPKVPGRALLTLSLLPAWYLAKRARMGRFMVMVARTERLARAFRERAYAVLDEPLTAFSLEQAALNRSPYFRSGPPSTARWIRAGSPQRTARPLTDLVICDPLSLEERREVASCGGLIGWIDTARSLGRTEQFMPSTLLVIDKTKDSPLLDMLLTAGWSHRDLPDYTTAEASFELSPAKSVVLPAKTRLPPLPADPATYIRLKSLGLSTAEIEVLLT